MAINTAETIYIFPDVTCEIYCLCTNLIFPCVTEMNKFFIADFKTSQNLYFILFDYHTMSNVE